MKKNISILLLSLVYLVAGCAKGSDQDISRKSPGKNSGITADNSFWNLEPTDEFIGETAGRYMELYYETDFIAGVSALKSNPLAKEFVGGFNAEYRKRPVQSRSNGVERLPYRVKINNLDVSPAAETRSSLSPRQLSALYGNTVDFSFACQTITRSGESDTVVKLYIPKLLEITSPQILSDEESFPLCYYRDFELRWNADEKNENGLIVVVEWIGTMIYGYDLPNMYLRRSYMIEEDNGATILDETLFDDIPDTALCYITLLRGNVENIPIGDYSYKIMGESHAVLPFVLVRHIKS